MSLPATALNKLKSKGCIFKGKGKGNKAAQSRSAKGKPCCCCLCSHTLTDPAPLAPADGEEPLGPSPAAGVSGAGAVSRCERWLLP
ncbi:hypothetical protein QTO34_007623 [Cnephaeus nilssonii]|uniref:Uncharacterized protein n=1 Tax=Cnephaeus nilssonii TaxID=3371016 RepID=A0AA40HIS2_CNENI|nr:hypothetical protein QTO34_007623 [Eptesicus nilssonii]